jgi:hypothetical protein
MDGPLYITATEEHFEIKDSLKMHVMNFKFRKISLVRTSSIASGCNFLSAKVQTQIPTKAKFLLNVVAASI